jgi:hypothetical protein
MDEATEVITSFGTVRNTAEVLSQSFVIEVLTLIIFVSLNMTSINVPLDSKNDMNYTEKWLFQKCLNISKRNRLHRDKVYYHYLHVMFYCFCFLLKFFASSCLNKQLTKPSSANFSRYYTNIYIQEIEFPTPLQIDTFI